MTLDPPSSKPVSDDSASTRPAEFERVTAHQLTRLAGNRIAAQYFFSLLGFAILMVAVLLLGDYFTIQVLFVFVVILIPWHHSAAILFFMVQATLFIHEGQIGLAKINYNPIVVSILSLIFIAIADRFRTSWRSLGDGTMKGLWQAMKTPESTWRSIGTDSRSGEDTPLYLLWRLLRLAVVATVVVFTASLVMVLISEQPQANTDIRLRPQELRAIMLGLLVLLVGIIATHVLSVIFWRTLSPSQARIYLKSELAEWLTPETRAVVVRRLKFRKRKLKKQ